MAHEGSLVTFQGWDVHEQRVGKGFYTCNHGKIDWPINRLANKQFVAVNYNTNDIMFPGDLLVKEYGDIYPLHHFETPIHFNVTKHKDAEPHSAAAANSMNFSDPIISPRVNAGNPS